MDKFIGIKDFLIAPIFLMLIYVWAKRRMGKMEDRELRKYFSWGLWLKVFGAIALGFIYQYYYGAGDTFSYYSGAQAFTKYFLQDPLGALQFVVSGNDMFFLMEYHDSVDYKFIFRSSFAEVQVVKFTGILNTIALGTYTSTAILFGVISMSGSWALYKTFLKVYPDLRREFAIAIFFVPSLVFWGSGILKDSITFAAIGWLTFAAYNMFFERRLTGRNILMILFSVYLIQTIKGYVLLAYVPALTFWLVNSFKSRIPSPFTRRVISPVLIASGLGLAFLLLEQISASLGKFSLENLETVAQSTQIWHTVVSGETGSAYSLGNADIGSVSGFPSVFPAAVNVTLFRPYIWEAGGIVMLMSALESLAILGLTLYAFFKGGLLRSLRLISSSPFVQFCLVFSLIFAFAVGFTAYNFGALVRYKIPMLPFYLAMLFIIISSKRDRTAQASVD